MKIFKKNKRDLKLIADFKDGYIQDWYFKLPEAFKDALDIQFTERTIDKKKKKFWTQGKCYAFNNGDVVYNRIINRNETWRTTLLFSELIALQIISASPATLEKITEEVKGKEKVKHYEYHEGEVEFKVLKPNSDKTALQIVKILKCSQVQFVEILKNGLHIFETLNELQTELPLN